MKHLNYWHYLFIILSIIVLASAIIRMPVSASAQSETVLSFSPGVTELYFNGTSTAQVQVIVTDVELLNAFDITITYDAAVAAVTAWSHGGFLFPDWEITKSNNPGFFRLAVTQLARPAVTGSGALINLTFSAVGAGSTSLTFSDVALSNSSSQTIPVTIHDGTIKVGYYAASSGAIYAQGKADRSGIPAALGVGTTFAQGPFDLLSLADIGSIMVFQSVPTDDTYGFTTHQPGYLNLDNSLLKMVTVAGGVLNFPNLKLLAGDVTADNIVTTADLDAIREAFGSEGVGLTADINADGVVDVRDLALAAGNFGLTSADAYGGWVP